MSMMRLIVYGDVPERSLKELAYQIEDDLTTLPSVSQVEVSGVRKYEISIEVPLHRLRALGLTLPDIAHTIHRSSLDLICGQYRYPGIPGAGSDPRPELRPTGFRRDRPSQRSVTVRFCALAISPRFATVFAETDLIVRHQNHPAVFVEDLPGPMMST